MPVLAHQQPRMTTVSWDGLIRLCRGAFERTAQWRSQARQLEALSWLDDRLLADIGLTREVFWLSQP